MAGVGRGLYITSTGALLCGVGQNLYELTVNPDGTYAYALLGSFRNINTAPLSFSDNRTDVVVADGSGDVYSIALPGLTGFGLYVDPNGLFAGMIKIGYIDTFLVWNIGASNQWASSLSNTLTTDPLYIAALTGTQYSLTTLAVNNRQILLMGTYHCELWFDAGNANFPFAEWPGIFVEYGTMSPYSVATYDKNIFWLSTGIHGQLEVVRFTNYSATIISDPVVVNLLQEQLELAADLGGATGYCYQQRGHEFYSLTLGDLTVVYDINEGMWHQRGWTDAEGVLHRERVFQALAFADTIIGQDWETGELFVLDDNLFSDAGASITYTKGLPHVQVVAAPSGMLQRLDEQDRVETRQLVLDVDTRLVPAGAIFSMTLSQDRGLTWQALAPYVMTKPGDLPVWWDDPSTRDPLYEVSWSFSAFCALNGAWLRGSAAQT